MPVSALNSAHGNSKILVPAHFMEEETEGQGVESGEEHRFYPRVWPPHPTTGQDGRICSYWGSEQVLDPPTALFIDWGWRVNSRQVLPHPGPAYHPFRLGP